MTFPYSNSNIIARSLGNDEVQWNRYWNTGVYPEIHSDFSIADKTKTKSILLIVRLQENCDGIDPTFNT